MSCLWRCDGCGYERVCDPLCGDDWDGEEVGVGPECPECEYEMDYVGEVDRVQGEMKEPEE